jgi:hypothetical protein
VEVMPVIEMRPVIDVAISVPHATATKDRRGAKAAAAMNGISTAAETTAMECGAAASESTAMESAAASETTASTTVEAAASATAHATASAAMTNFGRKPVGCRLYGRNRAGTCKRKRLGALV